MRFSCHILIGMLLVLSLAARAAESTPRSTPVKKSDKKDTLYLIGRDGLKAWREPLGDWKVVGDTALDPADNKKLAGMPGSGVVLNGDKGKTRDLVSKQEFGDVELHIEFMIPAKSNSGVYFMGRYEIQIYDSFGVARDQYPGIECGGIYQRWANGKGFEGRSPRVNASRQPGEWQAFDVIFRAPRFDASGKKIANARFVQVRHNGAIIHMDEEVTGPTRPGAFFQPTDEVPMGPILLQGDHGPVAYRDLRVTPLKLD